ncbi:MAG: HRDC domain-containing protein [Gemmatimonadota bacterium]|nr:HRDC domain-containing protein [Gemmatimonadota bacterium]
MMLSENQEAHAQHQAAFLDTPDDAAKWLAGIKDTPELAVDTEGASFHRFVDRVYLLQLSTREVNGIIDPLSVPAPAELGRLLESPDVEIVFHDADYDLRLLRQDYGWRVRHIFDTRVSAQLLGIKSFGLGALLEHYFGVKLEKKFQRADWSMRPLSQGMLDYAVHDTAYLLELRDTMRAELENAGRMEWAREEFERLESTQWSEAEDPDAFLRIKGTRDLTRRELALFRELVKWRDEVARVLDRATFRVVGNEALLEAARKVPRSASDLIAVKGMPRALVERAAGDIIAALDRGLAVPDAELPRFPRGARWDRDPDFDENVNRLKAVRDAAATRLELDPGVLCSRERLELIARRKPRSVDDLREIDGLRRWQIGVLGEEMVHALSPYR